MGGRDVGQESAAAMAGIERARPSQSRQHGGIEPPALALDHHRPIPMESQPFQIGEDRLLCPGPHARPVEIIKTEQPEAVGSTGVEPAQQGRAEVAAMEFAAGRGGKTAHHALLAQAQPQGEAFMQGIGKHD